MESLRPAAGVVPIGLRVVTRDFNEPRWDSCDGVRSSYGWDDVTIDLDFDSHGSTDEVIVAQVRARLSRLGWRYDTTSSPGAYYWNRRYAGATQIVQLLGGRHVDPPNPWSMEISAPPATHPVKGC